MAVNTLVRADEPGPTPTAAARPSADATPPRRRGPQALDAVDRAIVAGLRANARIAYADLARSVGLSSPSVTDRVRRLEQLGIITGYQAQVSPAALGLGVVALVAVEQTDDADQDEVGEALSGVTDAEDCWFVAGDESFVLKVRVTDVDALENLLGRLRKVPGVGRTRTTVVLSTRWEGRVPLPGDPGDPDDGGR
jgi:Lrp/AsnC family leucine-responsive transcriptional regulator